MNTTSNSRKMENFLNNQNQASFLIDLYSKFFVAFAAFLVCATTINLIF